MAQAAALLVATSSGRALAEELSSQNAYTYLVGGADGVPKVLLGVNGQPLLNHWLAAIKQCSRLSPLNERVFILCNESNIDEVRCWAADARLSGGGFPQDNILSNSSHDSRGLAADVATFLAAAPPAVASGSLLIAEADTLCGPGFSVARLVEHTVMRAKDTLSYMAAPDGMPLDDEAVLTLEHPAATAITSSQRVVGLDAAPSGVGNGAETLTAVLAPVAVLRPETVQRMVAAAETCSSETLGGLLAALQPGNIAHSPMYAMPLDCFFRLANARHVTLTSNFYAYYAKEKAGFKGDAERALEAARRLADLHNARTAVGGSSAAGVRLLAEVEASRPLEPMIDAELRRLYRAFYSGWMRGDRHHDLAAMAGRGITGASVLLGGSGAGGGHSGGGVSAGTAMPLRFAYATSRRHAAKEQHPVYTTTNNIYGLKPAKQADMPMAYAAASQKFSNTFPRPTPKNTGLVTAATKSKVHSTLDDF